MHLNSKILMLAMLIPCLTNRCSCNAYSQPVKWSLWDGIALENFSAQSIQSVQVYRTGGELNNPVVELNNADETLTLEFDDITGSYIHYDYTLIHCGWDWKPSGLLFTEFADGFEFNTIDPYGYSTGTILSYTHYNLTLPNEKVSFRISGNYILRVVDSNNHDSIVIQQRFMVVEPIISMNAMVRLPANPKLQTTSQQLELEVLHSPLGNIDPTTDIVTLIAQNNPTHPSMRCKPTFIDRGFTRYTDPDALVFSGGNEFRHIDLKSLHYQGQSISNIAIRDNEYHVQLAPDESRSIQKYSDNPDINGKFIVKRDDSYDSDIEAEYVWAYFTLQVNEDVSEDVYVFGELSGWTVNKGYRLNYNAVTRAYEQRILLKQGYYNYQYAMLDGATGSFYPYVFEGDFSQTENIYLVTVYYRQPGVRYWRLVGIKTLNSRYSDKTR
ncbi:MAG: DUF5103 domain-containing protein [Bacteroidales bacterium]|nr:DUF5103 domain-containing protein [Bacteroidales bacterium]HOA10200.1 DUF5103 domain-containing protein [Tenuifilaceae bacterium]HOC37057.1 DUF5103 domain-containing protein [Tenuifilaceae bacterium]HOG72623.1 DUF5103 domain-containing protein [Tenuifilaceae bacterium]HPA68353.1 DUF5103 domain-containing protein [Tenuifilaceae bacterium]